MTRAFFRMIRGPIILVMKTTLDNIIFGTENNILDTENKIFGTKNIIFGTANIIFGVAEGLFAGGVRDGPGGRQPPLRPDE